MAHRLRPKWFRCLVGRSAREKLSLCEISPDSFGLCLAASGGPRWLGLTGLDRVVKRYLLNRVAEERFPLLGASSGAWRLAAMTADDDGSAYEELIHEYVEQTYEGRPTPFEVSQTCRDYLARVFTQERVRHSLTLSKFQLNFTTALMASERPRSATTALALGKALLLNGVNRQHLGRVFKRAHFSVLPHPGKSPLRNAWDGIPTVEVELTKANFHQGLTASGSIPMVLEGESAVAGSPPGHHFDGGLVDYHFEIENANSPILYPHFSTDPIPGWLDRFFPYRKVKPLSREWLCLLVPSAEMIARFALQEFPDRRHFEKLSTTERKRAWRQTSQETEKMEAELALCLDCGELLKWSEPL